MNAGGFLDLIEDERRRPPPTPPGPAGEGVDALFLVVTGVVVVVVGSVL
jgi:hypothetical protein